LFLIEIQFSSNASKNSLVNSSIPLQLSSNSTSQCTIRMYPEWSDLLATSEFLRKVCFWATGRH